MSWNLVRSHLAMPMLSTVIRSVLYYKDVFTIFCYQKSMVSFYLLSYSTKFITVTLSRKRPI